jgi:hypothetical protein
MAHIPALILNQGNIPKVPQRGLLSIRCRQAGRAVKFNLTLEVIAQFSIKVLFNLMTAEQRPNAKADHPWQPHGSTYIMRGAQSVK